MTDSVESVLQKSREEFEKGARNAIENYCGHSWPDHKELPETCPECDKIIEAVLRVWQASRSALEPMLAEITMLRLQADNWKDWKALSDRNERNTREALWLHDESKKRAEAAEQALREAQGNQQSWRRVAERLEREKVEAKAENEKLRELLRRSPAMREPENCMCSPKATCLAHKWIGEVEQALSPSPTPARRSL